MVKIKNFFFLLVPAILVAGFALFLSISQYQPLYPDIEQTNSKKESIVAIFPEDPITGNIKAPKTIIAFEDFGCGRCREQMKLFDELLNKYPTQIKIIWKMLDVTTFPYSSELAHNYAHCTNAQKKFNEFKSSLLTLEDISENSLQIAATEAGTDKKLLQACLTSPEIKTTKEKNRQLAITLGLNTAPTVFIENKNIQEPLTLEGWENILSLQ